MKKLTMRDFDASMKYVLTEPEFNLFLIGDLENYGLDGPEVSAYTDDLWDGGSLPYFLLDYRGNCVFYSHDPDFCAEAVAGFLSARRLHNLSGKRELIEKIIPFMEGLETVPTHLARLDRLEESTEDFGSRRLLEEDIEAICELLIQTEEFYTMKSKTPKENREDVRSSLTHGGRMYGIFENNVLASVAGTTAENSISAMVVSVATLPRYRRKGYASALVSRLCADCLKEGMKFLCLFYDNPRAGSIYRRLGFKETGEYAMVRSKKNR